MSSAFKRLHFRDQKKPHASIESSIKRVTIFKNGQEELQAQPKDNRGPQNRRGKLIRTRQAKV